jgi:uncharacterized membrane protein YedE/YeeE
MHNFTPWSALVGGLLIGLSATLLLWLNGRIAGISGVLGDLLPPSSPNSLWRVLFLLGLVVGAAGYVALTGSATPVRQGFPIPLLLLAGVLTGFGTARANGCTSGHGVCGLARFSTRSLVATAVFLGVAVFTTFVLHHVIGIGL